MILASAFSTVLGQIAVTVIILLCYHALWGRKDSTMAQSPVQKPESEPPTEAKSTAVATVTTSEPAKLSNPIQEAKSVYPETALAGEIAAVIAAAVAVTVGDSARVMKVESADGAASHLNIWATEGRMQIFHSHKVR